MNKKLLSFLSLALLVSILPACGKKDHKRSEKKTYHQSKENGKHNKKAKKHRTYKKEVITDEEEMK
jgi:hypothetical protein